MRILYYNDDVLGDLIKRENNLMINSLKKAGADIELYNFQSNDKYRLKNAHFQVYENFLNRAETSKPDIAFIRGLSFPEFLLSELEVRKTEYKISFIFTQRELSRSMARANLMKKLISRPEVISMQQSLIGDLLEPSAFWKDVGGDVVYCKILTEPLDKNLEKFNHEKEEARDYFGIQKNKFVCLFFGRDNFTKGLDVLIDAFKYHLNKDFLLYIQTTGENREINVENIIYNNFFIEEKFVGKLFRACDLTILPYRKEYTYSGSWVSRLSFMAKRPIVAPDFMPFNKLINRFKLGKLFNAEDSVSLAVAIMEAKRKYNEIIEKAEFDRYLDIILNTDELGKVIVREWSK